MTRNLGWGGKPVPSPPTGEGWDEGVLTPPPATPTSTGNPLPFTLSLPVLSEVEGSPRVLLWKDEESRLEVKPSSSPVGGGRTEVGVSPPTCHSEEQSDEESGAGW